MAASVIYPSWIGQLHLSEFGRSRTWKSEVRGERVVGARLPEGLWIGLSGAGRVSGPRRTNVRLSGLETAGRGIEQHRFVGSGRERSGKPRPKGDLGEPKGRRKGVRRPRRPSAEPGARSWGSAGRSGRIAASASPPLGPLTGYILKSHRCMLCPLAIPVAVLKIRTRRVVFKSSWKACVRKRLRAFQNIGHQNELLL